MKAKNRSCKDNLAGTVAERRVAILALCFLACTAFAGNFYPGTSPATVPWPGGTVPYEFTNTLSAAQKQTYLDGLREWELAANVKFVPRASESRWILFAYNTNDFNNVSSGYDPQVVSISSLSRAQVAHEMGHSFGFTHENIRADQTNFLIVLSENITPGNLPFFQIDATGVPHGDYDFESVMHLAWDFASVERGVLPTQQPTPPSFPRHQFRMGNFALSPGDRAALSYLYGPPAVPLTNIVTTTADAGPGSLRAAMYYASDNPGPIVRFNIPTNDPGYSNGVFTIPLSGHLPTFATDRMVIDGSTQPGFAGKPLIVLDASQIIPETFTSDTLLIYSANNQIKNLSLQGFNWNGITLLYPDATNNTISGCWIGLDSTGSNAAPNAAQGILIDAGASRNIVGGTNAFDRNVLSGNRQYGIWISGSNTTGNVLLGNYIGTDAGGSFAISNAFGGVILTGATHGNVIGGTNPSARNVISGNTSAGLWITGAGVANNTVQGNYVGLNAVGTAAVPNSFAGMYLLDGARSNLVAQNVISGNSAEGLRLAGVGVTANVVAGNFIGTDAAGTNAVPNGFLGVGVYSGAVGNTIGGTTDAARNVISGNSVEGLRIQGVGATGNIVQGNYIGTDSGGLNPLPNKFPGLTIVSGAASNAIGGAVPGARNVISGNGTYGIAISDPGSDANVVQGNYIGLGADGSTALPNFDGVLLANGAIGNVLGGTTSAARNVISGNFGSGVNLTDAGTSGNFVQGNYIGTDAAGSIAVGNRGEGVYLHDGASENVIGGNAEGTGNVISGNGLRGIYAISPSTSGNRIQGNFIGTKSDGTNALGNNWDGVAFHESASNNVVGLASDGTGRGNTIAFNGFTGVYVGANGSGQSRGNTVRGNSIFSNGYLGINVVGGAEDLNGVTANDPGDADSGANNLQNYPVITNASASGASTTISGTLNSVANKSYIVDVYRNASPDPSGYGEGQIYLGSTTINTAGDGNAIFSLTGVGNFAGHNFSATATDQITGDTSEFSLNVLAASPPAPPVFTSQISMTNTGFLAGISVTIGQSYRVQVATGLEAIPIVWTDLTNFVATSTNFIFLDGSATNSPKRFYRAISP